MIPTPEVDEYYAAVHVITALQQVGHEAYLVGGCVRDLLLGRVPHDWDVVTSALPDQVTALFPHTTEVGRSFGVVPVNDSGIITQVATFRKDGVYSDNRRPDTVEFCGLQEDVLRRDFTVNGMVYDPLTNQVTDLVSGQKDLEDCVIRAIGDPIERFREDPLRILRAVRFATVLAFRIEEKTLEAIQTQASSIQTVAQERICEELRKLLASPHRSRGIRLLDTLGLLPLILPEISNLKGVEQPVEFHPEGDCWQHTVLCIENLPPTATFPQVMATLLHDIGKPPTYEVTDRIRFPAHAEVGERIAEEVCRRLKLTGNEIEEICWLVGNHMKIYEAENMRRSTLRRFISEPHFDSLLVVNRADRAASGGSTNHLTFLEKEMENYQSEPIRPVPILRGQDLLDLGVPPGPIYKEILQKVEDTQLEGNITSHEEAIQLARQLLRM